MSDYGSIPSSGEEGYENNGSSQPRRVYNILFAIAGTAAALTAGSAWAPPATTYELSSLGGDDTSSFGRFSTENEYKQRVATDYPGLHTPDGDFLVIEPSKATTVSLALTDDAMEVDLDTVEWKLTQTTNLNGARTLGSARTESYSIDQVSTMGSSLVLGLTIYVIGDYDIAVSFEYDTGGTRRVATALTKAKARYIRREIRGMNEGDRNDFLDAIRTMMDIGTDEGQRRYTSLYRDIDSLSEKHLIGASDKNVDHLHNGIGFLTQHSSITMEFEASVQSIAPHVACPYWDYTIDSFEASKHVGHEIRALWSQIIWKDSWFGNATSAEKTVTRGRFAYISIKNNRSMDSNYRNAYGYLRAPWNVNKSPYLTRTHTLCGASYEWFAETTDQNIADATWPTCESHHSLTFNQSTFYDWIWSASFVPHGPVHIMVGGYTNCGDLTIEDPALSAKSPNKTGSLPTHSEALKRKFLLGMARSGSLDYAKDFYRLGYADFPTFCSDDTPQEKCHMICASALTNATWVDSMIDLYSGSSVFGTWFREFPAEEQIALLKSVCTTPWTPGEQIEAASPVDPTFWPIHPTMDRLAQWKMITDPFNDTTWGDGTSTSLVCDQVVAATNCSGHNPEDLTLSESHYENDAGEFVFAYLSNRELLEYIDPLGPQGYRMSYYYDAFDWSHCAELGYAFRPANERKVAEGWAQFSRRDAASSLVVKSN